MSQARLDDHLAELEPPLHLLHRLPLQLLGKHRRRQVRGLETALHGIGGVVDLPEPFVAAGEAEAPAPPPPLLATGGLALSPQATRAHVRTKYRLINCALEC